MCFVAVAGTLQGQTIRISTDAGYVVASLISSTKVKAVHADRDYYWVRARQLNITQGGIGGDVLDGSYTAFHPDGQLMEQGRFDRGLKTGEWRKWLSTGALLEIVNWKAGRLHGERIRFIQEDSLVLQQRFRNGKEVHRRLKKVKAEVIGKEEGKKKTGRSKNEPTERKAKGELEKKGEPKTQDAPKTKKRFWERFRPKDESDRVRENGTQ